MSTLKTIAKGAVIVLLGAFASKGLTYVWRLLLARESPETYGLFSVGIAVLGITTVLCSIGLREGVSRYAAYYLGKNEQNRIKGVISWSLKITALLSIVAGALIFVFANHLAVQVFKKPELEIVLTMFAFAVPMVAIGEIIISALTTLQKLEYVVYGRDVLDSAFKICLAAIPIFLGAGLTGLSMGYAIATFLTMLTLFYYLSKNLPALVDSKVKAVTERREIIGYSLFLYIGTVLTAFSKWADTLFLGIFRSTTEVGVYNAAQPTAYLLMVAPSALLALFLSSITIHFARKEETDIRRLYSTVSRWVFTCNLPIFLGMLFFPATILTLLFGSAYAKDPYTLPVLATGFFIFSIFWSSSYVLNMLKKSKNTFLISLLVVIVSLGLNYTLVPSMGGLGAALASASAEIMASLLSVAFVYKYTRMLPFGKRELLAFGASGSLFYLGQQVALWMNLSQFFQLGFFVLLLIPYAILTLKLKLITPTEIEYLRRAALNAVTKPKKG